jgi:hypothetical protein
MGVSSLVLDLPLCTLPDLDLVNHLDITQFCKIDSTQFLSLFGYAQIKDET